MATQKDKVEQFLTDLSLTNPALGEMVQEIRNCIYSSVPNAVECVKYGRFMFSGTTQFCGVFAYTQHVSVEFSRGCDLQDTHQVLEGKDKLRRHIKFHLITDIEEKHLRDYIKQACC